MASVDAKCSEESSSLMMAEKAGRSLKLHIQQYLIRSYLQKQAACGEHARRKAAVTQRSSHVLTEGLRSRPASSSGRTSAALAARMEDPAPGTEESLTERWMEA